MKYMNWFTLGLLVATSAMAENSKFPVMIRKEKSNDAYIARVELPNLISDDSFEGKYFKIVKGKDRTPIMFDEKDEKLLLKAATTYYHLNKARDFWVDKMKSEKAMHLPQLVIRVDITNQFDELGHFAHDNKTPQFNNALTIPHGETPEWVPEEKKDQWNTEIWFRPMKSIPTKDLASLGPNPMTQSLLTLERPLLNYTQNQFNQRLMEQLFYTAYVTRPLHEDILTYAGTWAMMKVMIYASKKADPLFVEKYFYLDTAVVPEVAYHEYSHIILSDYLEMSHSTPVNEGMADYFAAVQSKKRKVYGKVKGHSNAAPKDSQDKKPYSHWDESNRFASADFTLSVLWDVRETLGEERGDQVVFEARRYLTTQRSSISDGLLRAILKACEDKCEKPKRDKLKLYEVFSKKGF